MARNKLATEVSGSVGKARQYLIDRQHPKGYWEGRVQDNVTITAEYVMLLRFLGILDDDIRERAKRTILRGQLPDGSWNIFYGGPPDHSATVEAYFALKLCGLTQRHKAMVAARTRILAGDGIQTTRVFTKINLALFGQYPWGQVPIINPELMLLPKKAPIHIYEFSSWSRAVIVPYLIVFNHRPVIRLSKAQGVSELSVPQPKPRRRDQIRELIKERRLDLESIFRIAQGALAIYEKIPLKPLRKQALDLAEKWILAHQDPNGNWGGIFPAMSNALMALHLRGYALDHPVMKKGLRALRSFADETENEFRMQSTVSPVWDTGLAAYALEEAGTPTSEQALQKTIEWLLRLQILDVKGDWRFKAKPARPGGWPFEHENDHYPDIDDSALAILTLLPFEHHKKYGKRVSHSIERGIEWILGMQGSDGGWGAFDRNNNRHILNQIQFADLKSLLDPSTPDVTGHVIEALGASGLDRDSNAIKKAIRYLRGSQMKDGSWYGRWGVAYVYGTGAVLSGLEIAGENMKLPYIRRALDFLKRTQNEDGGWGESCTAYDHGKYVPLGNSTPSQTAWGLLGFLASPEGCEKAIQKGVRYLLSQQKEDGRWDEPEWTGTGFPRHFYLRYDYYRLYFPLMVLGRFLERRR